MKNILSFVLTTFVISTGCLFAQRGGGSMGGHASSMSSGASASRTFSMQSSRGTETPRSVGAQSFRGSSSQGRVSIVARNGQRVFIPRYGRGWYPGIGYYFEGSLFYPWFNYEIGGWGFYYGTPQIWITTTAPQTIPNPCQKEQLKDSQGNIVEFLVCQKSDGNFQIVQPTQ